MQTQNRWLILAIVSIALFLIVVDMTVLYTALPRLTHDLAATASEKLWIVNAYPLVVAGLLPGAGTLGDRLGHKQLFVSGLVVFGSASLFAAYAPNPGTLIGARAILAVGAAMMMPATLSIIRHTFDDEKERSFAIGIWASVASGGAAIGPVIGGGLLEYFWWGSVFLINVPIVLLTLPLAIVLIPLRRETSSQPWDLIGSLQIMTGLIGLAYGVKEFAKRVPSYPSAALAACIGVIFIYIFVRRQRRAATPLIDFSLFRNLRFRAGVAAAMTAAVALIGIELVFSQRLQLVLSMSPLQAGLAILPIPIGSFIAGPLVGIALPRMGNEKVMWQSLLLAGVGMAAFIAVMDGHLAAQIVALGLQGFGLGAAMTAASAAIMMSAPKHRAGMAASIEEVSYELGGAIGVALMGSLLSVIYTSTLVLPDTFNIPLKALDSLDEALIIAETMPADAAKLLTGLAQAAFDRAFVVVMLSAAVLLTVTAVIIARFAGKSADQYEVN